MKAATALMLLCLPAIIKSFSLKIGRSTEGLFKPFHSSISKYSAVKTESSVQMNNVLNSEIALTAEEDELFATLRTVVSDGSLGTTVRVAGGWVRDKLLGVSGKEDIDIALDNMAGNDFAIALNTWHISKGFKSFRIGVIQSNPEKSKHLETATVQLGRLSVDFVNLRTETYAEDSRIPEMAFGTPEQDAMRRDLTINSLFYNIHTKKVEDYSNRGVADLKLGIISTPLPALLTMQDDPLRVLRAVRFACRFQFDIAEELLTASADPSVRTALGTKVSRERIYQEVEQMLRHKHAPRAIALLHYIQLLPLILPVPAIKDMCLSYAGESPAIIAPSNAPNATTSSASNGTSSASGNSTTAVAGGGENEDKKKKKKKSNEVEIIPDNTPEECSFIEQSVGDFHPYGGSAALIQTFLTRSSLVIIPSVVPMTDATSTSTSSAASSTSTDGDIILRMSKFMRDKTPFLFHFLKDLKDSQNDEMDKVLRLSSMTALGYKLSVKNPKKKKFAPPLTENILLIDLKMRTKDVEAAIIIQSAALVFADLIRQIIDPNLQPATDDVSGGPTHGTLSRLQLGLAIRKAGALYPQAIQLALSHLILEVLVRESAESNGGKGGEKWEKESDKMDISHEKGIETEVSGSVGGSVGGGGRVDSVYYPIFGALVAACELKKMRDAIHKYNERHPVKGGEIAENDLEKKLLHTLNCDNSVESSSSSNSNSAKEGSSHDSSRKTVSDILLACNNLLEALTALNLTESYKMTPLIAGDQMKGILKNIPRGTMFGEVMNAQVLWMLCHPSGTAEEFTTHLFLTYPDWK